MLPPRHRQAAFKAFWSYWPRRLLSERGALALALFCAVILMILSLAAPQFVHKTRSVVFDRLSIILTAMASPAKKISLLIEHVTGLSDMSSDLAAMREENAKLRQWYDRARQLEAENRSLRSLVHLADLPQSRAVTTRVIAESGGNFAQSVIVDAGVDENVSPSSVAMTGDGIVGRTMDVSDTSSHVLLLTDVNSRIPVVIENSRHRGILAGDNSSQPLLMYLPDDASVMVGERVLTSGDAAGIYAPGLPVGVVVSVQPRNIRIQPFADLRRLDFVQLIDFGRKDTTESEKAANSAAGAETLSPAEPVETMP
ncbi:MAG: rod shape-determining protein MreC [Alphaproteobacteria bacterium]|nr:rod shape-determining protein MreC [Alphaproteobacteria bacterium]